MLEIESRDARPPLRRGLILGGALLASGLALVLALGLGAWGFDFRRYSQHDGRLRRMLQQHPSLDRVERGLVAEGSPLVEAPEGRAALERVARQYGRTRADEVIAKGARWPKVRVFRAGDMHYLLYFDDEGLLCDYTLVSR